MYCCVGVFVQMHAVPFYQRLGYVTVGNEFDEDGREHHQPRRYSSRQLTVSIAIEPHILMTQTFA